MPHLQSVARRFQKRLTFILHAFFSAFIPRFSVLYAGCLQKRPQAPVLRARHLVFIMTVLLFAPCSLLLPAADAAHVTLTWNASTGPVAGYMVHYGETSGSYQYSVDVGNNTSCTISGLDLHKTYYYAVTAYDSDNNESDYSEEISYTISNIYTCDLNSKFQEALLTNNMTYYTDRSYRLTSVPSKYVGMEMIKTPNDDRNRTNASDYLTFEMPYDGTVYVAFDSRATSIPNWMSGFSYTGDRIYTSLSAQPYLKVYSKTYSSGACVNLGANKAPGFSGNTVSNYIVLISEDNS